MKIAQTPIPPYYAVIFTSLKAVDDNAYQKMATKMIELVHQQEGFLGFENAEAELGITISYWTDESSILKWKENVAHQFAQEKGIEKWYASYSVRVCKVERAYNFTK